MKIFYPVDKNGNSVGFRTPEAFVYDTTGKSLTDKLTELNSNLSQKATKYSVDNLTNVVNTKTNKTDFDKLYAAFNSAVSNSSIDSTGEIKAAHVDYTGATKSSLFAAITEADAFLDNGIEELARSMMSALSSSGEYYRTMKMVRYNLDKIIKEVCSQGLMTDDIIRQIKNLRLHVDQNIPDIHSTSGGVLQNRILIEDAIRRSASLAKDVASLAQSISDSVKFDYTKIPDLPVLYITGSAFNEMTSSKNKVTVNYKYGSLTGECTMKWQGSSSLGYPKHNFSITFDQTFEAKSGWGSQKKYVLKANYIDHTQARNIISAKLWGEVVKCRDNTLSILKSLPNGGAIDGFPILLVVNDEYHGIYTFNIPKDKWLYGINSTDYPNAIILTGESGNTQTQMREIVTTLGEDDSGWDLEFGEEETAVKAINKLINACINCTDESYYRNTVATYVDIDSCIDYFIMMVLLGNPDQFGKNQIIFSYDGIKFYWGAYDLDTTFGNHWNGKSYYNISDGPTFKSIGTGSNGLFKLIYKYDLTKLKSRYYTIRSKVYNEGNILYKFTNFMNPIPKSVYNQDLSLYPKIPGSETNNLAQIMNYVRLRIEYIDDMIESL